MQNTSGKIRSFTDLLTWQEGHKLVLLVYKSTESITPQEKFALVDQLRRAVVSITSNIAEGFGRRSAKDQMQFFYIALGSLKEVQNQLLIARDLDYIDATEFQKLAQQSSKVSQLLHGLIKSSQKKQ